MLRPAASARLVGMARDSELPQRAIEKLENGIGATDLEEPLLERGPADGEGHGHSHHSACCSWQVTTTALLSLQLGWGLWLFPSDFARLGWLPAIGVTVALALLTTYSGVLFQRLYAHVGDAVLFGDIGHRAAGSRGRLLVYIIIYSLDATRCVILHLAASQSLQHALGPVSPPLWQCGLVVLGLAGILVQVRSLAKLSGVFITGTCAQLFAIAIVVYQLLTRPDPAAKTQLVVPASGGWEGADKQLVAVMNMIFAFGGQFAFVELLASMRRPQEFSKAILVCTIIMASLYMALGAVGYWSKGADVAEIVIFSLGHGPLSRLAAGCILIQALAQYLVNLNVWTHNLLVLLARKGRVNNSRADLLEESFVTEVRCSDDHNPGGWAVASLFVIAYSYAISMSVPFFSSLVGIVASTTYLVCAYALPCWFALILFGANMRRLERLFCKALIPAVLVISLLGFLSSVSTLIRNIQSRGSGFGPESG